MKKPKNPLNYPGTSAKRLFHRFLVEPAFIEKTPRVVVLLFLLAVAAGLDLILNETTLTLIFFALLLTDWLLLLGLRYTGRSFGPIVPSLLGLALLRFLLAILLAGTSLRWLFWLLMANITLLVWYSTWIEPLNLTVTERSLIVPDWPAGAPTVRLLQLTDLHVEQHSRLTRQLNREIERLQPDLIGFCGDLLNLSYNRDPAAMEAARQIIGSWRAPLGVYAVSGSPLVDLPEAAEAVLGPLHNDTLRWLRDERVELEHHGQRLTLLGLSCSHVPEKDGPVLEQLLDGHTPQGPAVLLYHSPDLAPEAAAAGVDLQLSGHTHGGQIRMPVYGAMITSSIYGKRFEMGYYPVDSPGRERPMTLYVSRGIGMEGGIAPRARFLSPPEIILWTLRGPE